MLDELYPRRVTVFVDHYVRGELPARCVLSGVPTDRMVWQRTRVDGPSPIWLLALALGPVGLVVLLVALLSRRGGFLSGRLPVSEEAYARYRRARRAALGSWGVGSALVLLWVVGSDPVWTVPGAVGAVMIVGGVVGSVAVERRWPRLELDASRRWLTISRVHPDFVAAVRARAVTEGDRRA